MFRGRWDFIGFRRRQKLRKQVVGIGIVACVVALVLGGLCIAQPPAGGQGGRGGPGGQFDPAQMRQRMMDRMKEQLGADDASWKVLEPRLMKVMELSRQADGMGRGGMFGMMGGMRGQRGGNNAGDQGGRQRPQRDPATMTPVEKAQEQLRTTLENQSAPPEEIKKNLTALREAREKARQELATAQQELKKILTVRQEALLVMMGQMP
jgi:hypothetical protein